MTDKELLKQYKDSAPYLDAAFFLAHAHDLTTDEQATLVRLSTRPAKGARIQRDHELIAVQDTWRRRTGYAQSTE